MPVDSFRNITDALDSSTAFTESQNAINKFWDRIKDCIELAADMVIPYDYKKSGHYMYNRTPKYT